MDLTLARNKHRELLLERSQTILLVLFAVLLLTQRRLFAVHGAGECAELLLELGLGVCIRRAADRVVGQLFRQQSPAGTGVKEGKGRRGEDAPRSMTIESS